MAETDQTDGSPIDFDDGLELGVIERLSAYAQPVEVVETFPKLLPDSTDRLVRLVTRERVVEMRVGGWSEHRISVALGIPEKEVHRHLRLSLKRISHQVNAQIGELKALESVRLDKLWEYLTERAEVGDVEAVEVMLKISESRRKLLGLDKPTQQEITMKHPEVSIYLPEVVEEPLEILPGDSLDGSLDESMG